MLLDICCMYTVRLYMYDDMSLCLCCVAYHRLGIRSAIPVMPAMMLLWEIMTPFGMPVDPLVYMMTAMSEGSGCLRSRAAVM